MKRNEVTLKQAINELIDTYRLKGKINETRLLADWEKVVGPMIARQTRDMWVKEQVLYIKIESAPLKSELQFSKDQLVDVINDHIGEVMIKEVVIR